VTYQHINEAAKKEKIGEFSTKFGGASQARTHNMKLASIAIDQYVINPGDTFSFNELVGYASKENGYLESVIFVNGEKEMGYGGGICQVSSTLYNAGMAAALEIVERHPHSKPVGYVEKGKDAATSYGGVDLKMKNNFDFPVTINTYMMNNDTFTVEILK
jgi:vancomycin resistance protein YoaR